MHLDPATGLVFLVTLTVVSGCTALALWRLHPHLHGLGILALGNLLTVPTFLSLMLRDVHGVTVHNTMAVACTATLAEGLSVFMGRPANPRFVLGATALTAVLWEAMLAVDPDALPLRVVAITALSLPIFGRCLWSMMRDGAWRHLDVAKAMIVGVLATHMLTLVVRMAIVLAHPDRQFARSDQMQGWFFLELTLVDTVLFFAVLMMVGSRLAHDLRQQSLALVTERHLKSELRQLLHMLGHELRTPLAIAGRTIDSVRTLLVPPPPEVERQLATLRATVDRVERLTETLLTAERTDMIPQRPEMLDLAQIVVEATAMLHDKWGGGRLRLELGDEEHRVLGDHDLLFTAVVNLLDNALKYAPADSPATVSLRRHQGESVLCVADHGIGFPSEQLPRVGQRFFRASNVGDIPGTGLGLYMVKTIAQRHGGRVELGNGDDGGAEVTLILPAA